MAKTLDDFPITRHWAPRNPDRLQLYSFPTPNGVKVSIALEELGVPYDAHTVPLSQTTTPAFLSLNPNNKIPAIIDPDGPGGEPFGLWESGAILIYLAEKHGGLLPSDPARRLETIQWLMFQMGGVGPMFGQYGFFGVFAGKDIEDPRPRERYVNEARRLLGVLEQRLEDGRDWIMGAEYTIADIAIFPWVRGAKLFYKAEEPFEMASRPHVMAWLARCIARPASERGLVQPPRE
ncbi:MAG: glutathione S-transferase N-terminal domain-containing protein [Roseitalea sp.]|jgi:GST-like protein|nr:glutathione S-transferase N-terminal domain-containing protein [Roseitalea sp.]MBO6723243.1 glutathione S-transferase N-terminal domain-containing protein [Roseitalea sp.]MBO6744417.1 glutathione S-transferase N-terminal domain-containing protein [Roseitalea sp.]